MNKCSAGTVTLGYSAAQSYTTTVNAGQNPPLSESFDLSYDGLNRVSTVTRNSDNQVVTYSYDASTGRPSSVNLSDEGTFSFSYLSNGKLESVTCPGQQGAEDYSYGSASYSGELYYHYDALGNTTLLTDAGGNPKASFIYDLHTGKMMDSWNPDNLVIINLNNGIGGNLGFELPEGIKVLVPPWKVRMLTPFELYLLYQYIRYPDEEGMPGNQTSPAFTDWPEWVTGYTYGGWENLSHQDTMHGGGGPYECSDLERESWGLYNKISEYKSQIYSLRTFGVENGPLWLFIGGPIDLDWPTMEYLGMQGVDFKVKTMSHGGKITINGLYDLINLTNNLPSKEFPWSVEGYVNMIIEAIEYAASLIQGKLNSVCDRMRVLGCSEIYNNPYTPCYHNGRF